MMRDDVQKCVIMLMVRGGVLCCAVVCDGVQWCFLVRDDAWRYVVMCGRA